MPRKGKLTVKELERQRAEIDALLVEAKAETYESFQAAAEKAGLSTDGITVEMMVEALKNVKAPFRPGFSGSSDATGAAPSGGHRKAAGGAKDGS
jgi:hypothetical protein